PRPPHPPFGSGTLLHALLARQRAADRATGADPDRAGRDVERCAAGMARKPFAPDGRNGRHRWATAISHATAKAHTAMHVTEK
ncbi:hypothetical protein, partial [Ralstonia solanacearum]|uniref:hypothetical protein n=1 Tax=Ralstonia solanacearum TaxID=305 RepID=UPI001E65DC48